MNEKALVSAITSLSKCYPPREETRLRVQDLSQQLSRLRKHLDYQRVSFNVKNQPEAAQNQEVLLRYKQLVDSLIISNESKRKVKEGIITSQKFNVYKGDSCASPREHQEFQLQFPKEEEHQYAIEEGQVLLNKQNVLVTDLNILRVRNRVMEKSLRMIKVNMTFAKSIEPTRVVNQIFIGKFKEVSRSIDISKEVMILKEKSANEMKNNQADDIEELQNRCANIEIQYEEAQKMNDKLRKELEELEKASLPNTSLRDHFRNTENSFCETFRTIIKNQNSGIVDEIKNMLLETASPIHRPIILSDKRSDQQSKDRRPTIERILGHIGSNSREWTSFVPLKNLLIDSSNNIIPASQSDRYSSQANPQAFERAIEEEYEETFHSISYEKKANILIYYYRNATLEIERSTKLAEVLYSRIIQLHGLIGSLFPEAIEQIELPLVPENVSLQFDIPANITLKQENSIRVHRKQSRNRTSSVKRKDSLARPRNTDRASMYFQTGNSVGVARYFSKTLTVNRVPSQILQITTVPEHLSPELTAKLKLFNEQIGFFIKSELFIDSLAKRMQKLFNKAHALCSSIGIALKFMQLINAVPTSEAGLSQEKIFSESQNFRLFINSSSIYSLSIFKNIDSDENFEEVLKSLRENLLFFLSDYKQFESKLLSSLKISSEEDLSSAKGVLKVVESRVLNRSFLTKSKVELGKLVRMKKNVNKKSSGGSQETYRM